MKTLIILGLGLCLSSAEAAREKGPTPYFKTTGSQIDRAVRAATNVVGRNIPRRRLSQGKEAVRVRQTDSFGIKSLPTVAKERTVLLTLKGEKGSIAIVFEGRRNNRGGLSGKQVEIRYAWNGKHQRLLNTTLAPGKLPSFEAVRKGERSIAGRSTATQILQDRGFPITMADVKKLPSADQKLIKQVVDAIQLQGAPIELATPIKMIQKLVSR